MNFDHTYGAAEQAQDIDKKKELAKGYNDALDDMDDETRDEVEATGKPVGLYVGGLFMIREHTLRVIKVSPKKIWLKPLGAMPRLDNKPFIAMGWGWKKTGVQNGKLILKPVRP